MRTRLSCLILVFSLVSTLLWAEDHLQFGQPACAGPVLDKKYFVLCHDAARKIPVWVGYVLTKEDALAKATSRQGSFRADTTIPRGERAQNADYSRSGYDKGHMAPANDFTRSVEAMKSTFILSNSVPQRHGVNGGQWARLEGAVHALAATGGPVWIFSGPVFAGQRPIRTIGRGRVAVPTHTFKVVLRVRPDGNKEMLAFVLPNIEKPSGTLSSYTFSVDTVERLTGLDFFASLPPAEQDQLESVTNALPAE